MRDLGVDLRRLVSISMNDCSITELDGIGALVNIKILSLRNNIISDVSPIAMHDVLEVNLMAMSTLSVPLSLPVFIQPVFKTFVLFIYLFMYLICLCFCLYAFI
jgi:hypothetical protein